MFMCIFHTHLSDNNPDRFGWCTHGIINGSYNTTQYSWGHDDDIYRAQNRTEILSRHKNDVTQTTYVGSWVINMLPYKGWPCLVHEICAVKQHFIILRQVIFSGQVACYPPVVNCENIAIKIYIGCSRKWPHILACTRSSIRRTQILSKPLLTSVRAMIKVAFVTIFRMWKWVSISHLLKLTYQ
jgi:hypothetical protein